MQEQAVLRTDPGAFSKADRRDAWAFAVDVARVEVARMASLTGAEAAVCVTVTVAVEGGYLDVQ